MGLESNPESLHKQLLTSYIGNSATSLLKSILDREAACLNQFAVLSRDRQQEIYNGPGGYRPCKDTKLAVIEDVAKILPHIVPEHDSHAASILWHNDLHLFNIFVDKNQPSTITGIIDWQSVHLSPAFLQVHYPALIDHDGPQLDGFVEPKLPLNYKDLDPPARKAAKELHVAQSLHMLYRIWTQKQAPDLVRTFAYRNTLPCEILALAGSVFDDGEAYLQSLLARCTDAETWAKISKSQHGCPLSYSDAEMTKQAEAMAKWERDVELKAHIIREVGAYTGWDGAVSPEEFESVSKLLAKIRTGFILLNSKTQEEQRQWAAMWPFGDSSSEDQP